MVDSFDIVIFGGKGDLSIRKLMPALYRCELDGKLSKETRIFATSRGGDAGGEEFFQQVYHGLEEHLDSGELATHKWDQFRKRLHHVVLDIASEGEQWSQLAESISAPEEKARIFYLAIPANLYGPTCAQLSAQGLIKPSSRVVLEKPIGYDLESARNINAQVAEYFSEEQIYRIDHYLGKETVQNLLALRFTNSLFERLWDARSIDNVQITLSETVGLEGRASFYDQAGALRDMVQNHLLQLFCLVAMEPPNKMTADNIRSEKLKVMQALRPIRNDDVLNNTVRGQYAKGRIEGDLVPGYLQELKEPDSSTETYVAIRAHVDNWRWAGVPFYLRTGKRMKERFAEIAIQFKPVSHRVYPDAAGSLAPNSLVIRLQPEESIKLSLMTKELNNTDFQLKPVTLDLDFSNTYEGGVGDAYQRLLLDVAQGNPTLFAHRDEVEQAWTWLTPILDAWQEPAHRPQAYAAGSWGPERAEELLTCEGRQWFGIHDDKKAVSV